MIAREPEVFNDPADSYGFPVFKRAAKAKFGPLMFFGILRILWALYKLAKAAHLFGQRAAAWGRMMPLVSEVADYPAEINEAIAAELDARAKNETPG